MTRITREGSPLEFNLTVIGLYQISVRERGKLESLLGKWLATVVTFAGVVNATGRSTYRSRAYWL